MSGAATMAATPRRALTLGLFRAGGSLLALPVDALREVLRAPPDLVPVPGTPPFVLGAANVRGTLVPVVDLGAVLGLHGGEADHAVIVIVRQYGRLVGLAGEAVTGMVTVDRRDLRALQVEAPAGPVLQTHSLFHDGQPGWLLDAARIAALPGLPMVDEVRIAADTTRVAGRVTRLLFGSGGFRFAIRATDVEGTVARAPLEPGPLNSALCHGVIAYHGRRVPVVDPLHVLGFGRLPEATESPVLVLRCAGKGLVGFRIDEVHDMVAQEPSDLAALPPLVAGNPDLFDGITLDGSGRQHFVLSADGLRRDDRIDTYACLSTAGEMAASGREATARALLQQVLVFTAGGRFAVPLLQVHEVIAFPAQITRLDAGPRHVMGLFDHRGQPVPLVALDRVVGGVPTGPASRVLLVSVDGRLVGFTVSALHGIEAARPVQPHDPRATTAAARPSMNALVDLPSEGGRIVPLLDLQALGRDLAGDGPASAAPRRAAAA